MSRSEEPLRSGTGRVAEIGSFTYKDIPQLPEGRERIEILESCTHGSAASTPIKRELAQRVWAERGDRVDRKQYMALFMANPVPMWIYDVETLNILAVNDAALARYGATATPAMSSCV